MKQSCPCCMTDFELDKKANYCPFCGFDLTDENVDYDVDNSYFFDILSACFSDIKLLAIKAMAAETDKYLVDNDYAEIYKSLQKSQSKKSLFLKLENYIAKLKGDFDSVLQVGDDEFLENFSKARRDYEERIEKVYALFTDEKPKFEEIQHNIKLEYNYDKDELKEYLKQLEISFQKFKKCVNDTDLFNAFNTDKDYGTTSVYCNNGDENEFLGYDIKEETKKLKESNEVEYQGFLDENTDAHISSFWRAFAVAYNALQYYRMPIITPSVESIFDDCDKLYNTLKSKISDRRVENVADLVNSFQKICNTSTD